MKTIKLILACAVLCAAHLASGEMLYWMIGDKTNGGENSIEFEYALLYAVNGEDKIVLPTTVEGGGVYGNDDLSLTTTTGPQMTEFDGIEPANCSYYVELFAWEDVLKQDVVVGVSEWETYESLVSNGHVIPTGMSIPSTVHVWMPATTVPEPTSALLLVFGMAGLLLRRRKICAN